MTGGSSTYAWLEAAVSALTESPVRALLLVAVAALLEGPVVTIAAAALAGSGHLPWWGVWVAATLADVVGDTLLLTVGRLGNRPLVERLITRLGLTAERREPLIQRVLDQFPQVVLTAKLADITAVPAYLAAGFAGVPYGRFLRWIIPATAVRAATLVGLGYLAGTSLLMTFGAHPGLVALGGIGLGIALLTIRSVVVSLSAVRHRVRADR